MKIIEIGDDTYKILEEIADEWNKRSIFLMKEDPDFKFITDWNPESVLYVLTMCEYKLLKEENENTINQNE